MLVSTCVGVTAILAQEAGERYTAQPQDTQRNYNKETGPQIMAAYEILIADDHPLFRSALRQALTLSLGSTVRLVEAENIAELESCLQEKSDWDLVLLDLNMPGAHGFSGLVLLRGQYPQVPVVMISAQEP